MKKLLKYIIYYAGLVIGKISLIIYPSKVSKLLSLLFKEIYTIRVSYQIKNISTGVSFDFGLILLNGKYISIAKNTKIGKRVTLTAWDTYESNNFSPLIKIGENVSIGDDCHITAINSITIGNNVLLGKKITITDNSHGNNTFDSITIPPIKRSLHSKGAVVIEDNVWIGDKVTILPNVHIGYGSIVGSNAVVTTDIPAYCIVGGIPAKILKQIKI